MSKRRLLLTILTMLAMPGLVMPLPGFAAGRAPAASVEDLHGNAVQPRQDVTRGRVPIEILVCAPRREGQSAQRCCPKAPAARACAPPVRDFDLHRLLPEVGGHIDER